MQALRVKIFADDADKTSIVELASNPLIQGFTTNPALMRKAGVKDYEAFGRELIAAVPGRPCSFEVLSDEFDEMERQALRIASWGSNVYVKIPIINTRGESAAPLIGRLSDQGVKVNVTAVMTLHQVDAVLPYLRQGAPSYLSILGSLVADAGHDPLSPARRAQPHPRHAAHRADLGESARSFQHRAGGRDRLPYHHRHLRHVKKAPPAGTASGRLFARHGKKIPC
jgi:transaldolase